MSVIDFLDRGALLSLRDPCIISSQGVLSYAETQCLTNRVASRLLDRGWGPGRHAAVLSINDPRGYLSTLGVLRAGMSWVPMNPLNATQVNRELLLFTDAEVLFYHSRFHDFAVEMRDALPKLSLLVCIDHAFPGVWRLEQWLEGAAAHAPDVDIAPEDTAWLQSTGGTTGRPKVVMMTHRNFQTQVANFLAMIPDPAPIMLVAAPLTHAAGGLTFHVLASGGTIVILPKPEPFEILAAIEKFRVTQLFLPPTVIYRLLDHPEVERFDYSSLRYFLYGAAPMSVEKLRRCLAVFGPVMTQMYGQTEAPGNATLMTPVEHFENGAVASDARLAACGRPTPLTRVEILGDASRKLPRGQAGEICIRGDLVMKGYYNNPEATAATIIDGWLHTGDVGFQDEQGYVHVVDRKKDMIISGGFNIYPGEIEQVIWAHEAVRDCAVIGVPDEEWGEAVKAVVELVHGRSTTAEELIGLCREKLGALRAPKTVDFVASLPRSAVGKVLKRELRERYWADRARRV